MANKTFVVIKAGDEIDTMKNLTAAKKLADAEGAEVLSDGKCVYRGNEQDPPDATTEEEKTPANVKYRLKHLMNVRKAPGLDADKIGLKSAGEIVNVIAIENDWLHLENGAFILFGNGKYAEKI